MFKQIFAMIAQAALMMTNLFTAGTKLSNAAVHSASFVEGAAESFAERTQLERLEELDALRGKYSISQRIRAAEQAQSVRTLEDKLAALRADDEAAKSDKAA